MNKKILFSLFVFLILFVFTSIAFFIFSSKKEKQVVLPPLESAPTYPSSQEFESIPESNFSYITEPPKIPKTLPVFTYTTKDIFPLVIDFAKKSNFSINYTEISPGIFDFQTTSALLTFNKQAHSLSFSWNINSGKSIFSSYEDVFKKLEESQITLSFSLKERNDKQNFENEGDVDLSKQLQRKTFDLILPVGYPFILDPINRTSLSFTTHVFNGITSFLVRIPPVEITKKEDRLMIQADEILLLLKSKKAGLYTVSNIPPTTMYTTPNFTHVFIQSVDIIYMKSPSEELLIPFFKISGIGKGRQEEQYVEFFMIGIR